MRIEWHPSASADLINIVTRIAEDNPAAAYDIHEEIIGQARRLERYPLSGREGRLPGVRELVVYRTPYIAAYRVMADCVTILRVLHGARRWPPEI
ncbi:type II toxin-antitoxin system RelE/ParE family toxin [Inquilinus sp. CAU 1745]|uniref:type II toxin-antitoxin system RelE/ParE family toxin n=1 Tax=Inquilinus sp. CAU 1745 TaxID=3140369 RepID=UPI00325B52F7